MHMADALLAPGVAGVMYACSAVAAGRSVRKLNQQPNDKAVPVMGVMGAFVFAAQMINFTIPGTGSSGHLCGGMLLGRHRGSLRRVFDDDRRAAHPMPAVCRRRPDGVGGQHLEYGVLRLFCGRADLARLYPQGAEPCKNYRRIADWRILSLQLGAFSVSVETLASGITALPFGAFLLAMQPIHLAIGAVEGCITAAVLVFLYEARPSLLWQGSVAAGEKQRLTLRGTLGVLAGAAVVVAGGLSLLASAFPDGFEWSLQRLTGSTELETTGPVQAFFARIQEWTALLPDYNFAGSDAAAGTSAAGIIGAVVVLAVVILGVKLVKKAVHQRGSSAQGH